MSSTVPIDWTRDAFGHLKVVGPMAAAEPLAKAYIAEAEGVNDLDARTSIGQYIEAANRQRVWNREARLSEGAL